MSQQTAPGRLDSGDSYLDLGLYLAQLPPRQHLDVRADLFARPRLARAQFNITRNQLVATCKQKQKSKTCGPIHFRASIHCCACTIAIRIRTASFNLRCSFPTRPDPTRPTQSVAHVPKFDGDCTLHSSKSPRRATTPCPKITPPHN